MNQIQKTTPIQCPNDHCSAICNNETDLQTHLNFHCHLTNDERNFFIIPEDSGLVNRKLTTQTGLPSKDSTIANGNVKYNSNDKTWECLICHKKSSKYNRRQIINHVNTKHTADKKSLRTKTARGTHIEKENDKILLMESDYGRIRHTYGYDEENDEWARTLQCLRCHKSSPRKSGIKQHLTIYNDMGKSYNLDCPYCPSNFSTLAELNIHIYDKICPFHPLKNPLEHKTWQEIWEDMCNRNKTLH